MIVRLTMEVAEMQPLVGKMLETDPDKRISSEALRDEVFLSTIADRTSNIEMLWKAYANNSSHFCIYAPLCPPTNLRVRNLNYLCMRN